MAIRDRKVLPPSEFGGRDGVIQREEDGHPLTVSEEHTLAMRHGVDTPKARKGGVDRLHRQGLVAPDPEEFGG